jgi:hypothetical protein
MSRLGLASYNHDICFIKQIYLITMFYIVNVIIEFLIYFLGNDVFSQKGVICANDMYLIVQNDMGSILMTFDNVTFLLYSLVMLQIFYFLPKRYQLISYRRRGQQSMNLRFKATQSMIERDDQLINFVKVDDEQRLFEDITRPSNLPSDNLGTVTSGVSSD